MTRERNLTQRRVVYESSNVADQRLSTMCLPAVGLDMAKEEAIDISYDELQAGSTN